jgi:hypothetical protein
MTSTLSKSAAPPLPFILIDNQRKKITNEELLEEISQDAAPT